MAYYFKFYYFNVNQVKNYVILTFFLRICTVFVCQNGFKKYMLFFSICVKVTRKSENADFPPYSILPIKFPSKANKIGPPLIARKPNFFILANDYDNLDVSPHPKDVLEIRLVPEDVFYPFRENNDIAKTTFTTLLPPLVFEPFRENKFALLNPSVIFDKFRENTFESENMDLLNYQNGFLSWLFDKDDDTLVVYQTQTPAISDTSTGFCNFLPRENELVHYSSPCVARTFLPRKQNSTTILI